MSLIFYVDEKTKKLVMNGDIKSGSVTGETTVNVGTDLHVGNNVFLGDQETDKTKSIKFNKNNLIVFGDGRGLMNYQKDTTKVYIRMDSTMGYPLLELSAGDSNKTHSTLRLTEEILSFFIGGEAIGAFSGSGCSFFRDISASKSIYVSGDLSVGGEKNRVVKTKHYGMRKLNAVESASCYFTDEGQIQLDSNGKGVICFDPIWLETVNTNRPYHVHLTPYCEVSPWIAEEYFDHCVVAGKPNTKVNWHISASQKNYDSVRLEEYREEGD